MEWYTWNDEKKQLIVLCHLWQALSKDDKALTQCPFEILCHYSAQVRHLEVTKIDGHFPNHGQMFPKLKSISFHPRTGCLTKWDCFPVLLKAPKCHPFCELQNLVELNKQKIHTAIAVELCLYRHRGFPKDLAKMISAMLVAIPYGEWTLSTKKWRNLKKLKNNK